MANNLDKFTNVFGRSKFDKMVHTTYTMGFYYIFTRII